MERVVLFAFLFSFFGCATGRSDRISVIQGEVATLTSVALLNPSLTDDERTVVVRMGATVRGNLEKEK